MGCSSTKPKESDQSPGPNVQSYSQVATFWEERHNPSPIPAVLILLQAPPPFLVVQQAEVEPEAKEVEFKAILRQGLPEIIVSFHP